MTLELCYQHPQLHGPCWLGDPIEEPRSYLSRVDAQELLDMRKVLRKMNRDGRFRCEGL